MLTITATFDLTILYFVAATVICILVYVLVSKRRARRAQHELDFLTATVIDFFHSSGEQVAVQCISEPGGGRFVALIDSMPSKRFRYSHVVAVILANHVRKACGVELERIYWRFPLKAIREESQEQAASAEAQSLVSDTEKYLAEGLRRLNQLPQYEVTESSWDKFQELTGSKAAVC